MSATRHPSPSPDVLVIGAGVIGLSIAWRAARAGLAVRLVDRDTPGTGTTRLGAGMIAPVSEALATELPLLHLGLASSAAYPRFLDELRAEAGPRTGGVPELSRAGTLLVARDDDEAEALERELTLRRELSLPARRMLGSEARRLEPALGRVRLALLIPADQALDPRLLCAALLDAGLAGGVSVTSAAPVRELRLEGGAVTGAVLEDGTVCAAARTVLAAGVGSAAIGGVPAAAAAALRPVKGQIMRLRDPGGAGLVTRVLRTAAGYLVPRGDGRYVLGATVEERGFDRTVTAGGVHELLRDVLEIVPGVSELAVEEIEAGLRPGSSDNAPLLGPDRLCPGLIWATGHYRHGILLAPVTAQLVLGWLTGEPPAPSALDLGAFSPSRFAPAAIAGVMR